MKYSLINTSVTTIDSQKIWMIRDAEGNRYLQSDRPIKALKSENNDNIYLLSPENAKWLRSQIPWLNPQPLGLKTSVGTGDRLGISTPGHIRAFQGTQISPVLAQQSVRELIRTHRTAQMVLDDAMWGVFEAGWNRPWGADADHLKTIDDMREYYEAGFTFFTIDPGEYVKNLNSLDNIPLQSLLNSIDYDLLATSESELINNYTHFPDSLDFITASEQDIKRAFIKYGGAIHHVQKMYFQLKSWMGNKPFDFEVSVDETDEPTTIFEHYFIACELKRLGIEWTSLAPRFVGKFEKGVDYQGDLHEFESEYRKHAAIQKYFGNYKISIHSGSDKFSIYKICAVNSEYKTHLKTAGTSYLEALRIIATVDPELFRKIYDLSMNRYEIDKASYYVSAHPENLPKISSLADDRLPDLLNQFDSRQVLHVCFGAVLDQYGTDILRDLNRNYDLYLDDLEKHLRKHLQDFIYSKPAEES
ncbi:MAG TPA: tagaturonate epimerase family protein [Flexilinea sp.]|nr:MAG: hypothetical protein BWY58_01588 [Chloroflexi bacterium ADurb.Bin344]HOG22269.1 tagaturonate epimerase family protein [Flexilinea sp.]HOR56289.1 tagaturonate epimerase family protein [Flexilinea sp.]